MLFRLVLSEHWLAMRSGSLSMVACSHLWFSCISGLLHCLVLFVPWLALHRGSLLTLACSLRWFSAVRGLLTIMVLLFLWLAGGRGSLLIVADCSLSALHGSTIFRRPLTDTSLLAGTSKK